jgi:FlaA1/EpsC-like NDP-sugar epimerase
MAINLVVFYISYYLIIFFGMPAVVDIQRPKTMALLFIAIIFLSFIYQFFNLYRPIPYIGTRYSLRPIILANLSYFSASLIFSALVTSGIRRDFILLWTLTVAVISTVVLLFKKRFFITIVRLSRRQRDIVKKVIIVGDNRDSARYFVKEVINDNHNGIMLLGGVGRKLNEDTGCEKLGDFEDLPEILDKYKPDYVVFAVESYKKHSLVKMVNLCDDRCIKVFFLPVIYGFFKSSKQLESVGTVPLINVHSTPLDSRFNSLLKRTVDIVGSIILIILTSPLMLMAVIGVKLSSPGPILFKQMRVGCMGKKFKMLKFRSMRRNDEEETAWTTDEDPRRTKIGAFLRKTSLDELP